MRGRHRYELLVVATLVAGPPAAQAPAMAQETDASIRADVPGTQRVSGRLSLSSFFYDERAPLILDNEQASDQILFYGDLRGKLQIDHQRTDHWRALGDFRLRLASEDRSARGFVGGDEFHLRELYFRMGGERLEGTVGRQIVSEVDAIKIDGASVVFAPKRRWYVGGLAGLYPNRLSRSVDTDYRKAGSLVDMPMAAGAWTGYRGASAYGSVAAAAVAPRDSSGADEPVRVFVATSGYARIADAISVFHSAVVDVVGNAGFDLVSAMFMGRYQVLRWLRLEMGASHMSTSALEVFVRDYLETEDANADVGAPVQNNITFIRMASTEGRFGVVVDLPRRISLFSHFRARRRGVLGSADLPMEIADLPADRQIEVGGGARASDLVVGIDAQATALAITGQRTRSKFFNGSLRRGLLGGRMDVEASSSYIVYHDRCTSSLGDTCTGLSSGALWRIGGAVAGRPGRHWSVFGNYSFSRQKSASSSGMRGAVITGHTGFVRLQYSF